MSQGIAQAQRQHLDSLFIFGLNPFPFFQLLFQSIEFDPRLAPLPHFLTQSFIFRFQFMQSEFKLLDITVGLFAYTMDILILSVYLFYQSGTVAIRTAKEILKGCHFILQRLHLSPRPARMEPYMPR